MAQLKSMSACSAANLTFHAPKRESYPYQGRVCCPGKLSSFQELGARKSELQGNAFAVTSGNGSVRAHNKQVIRAVLPTYSETEVSGSTKERGLRGKLNKVVLAYSGGLDTSVIVPWLRENYGCDVVCFTADVGQGIKELDGLEKKAKASGASQLVVKDLKEEFVKDYIFPCLRAGAIYERKYLLGTSMARPVIAKAMVDVAKEVGADAVAHGCTGKGNDQVRFELTFFALNPKLNVVAPWREWDITGREDAIEYAKKHNVPVPVTKKSIYSRDGNLWHLSHEGDILEDPENEPKKDMFMLTVDPEDAPNKPEYVEIGIVSGIPISVNGKELSPASLLDHLNQIGGKHGIGRVDMVENRLVGMKSRGVYETPGGTILFAAARELESLTLDRETMQVKDSLALKYAELVYAGRWFDPLRESLDSFMEEISKTTTGSVTLKLYKGSVTVTSRKSPYSLYRQDISSFESGDIYDQADAAGFIRLYGLPIRVRAKKAYCTWKNLWCFLYNDWEYVKGVTPERRVPTHFQTVVTRGTIKLSGRELADIEKVLRVPKEDRHLGKLRPLFRKYGFQPLVSECQRRAIEKVGKKGETNAKKGKVPMLVPVDDILFHKGARKHRVRPTPKLKSQEEVLKIAASKKAEAEAIGCAATIVTRDERRLLPPLPTINPIFLPTMESTDQEGGPSCSRKRKYKEKVGSIHWKDLKVAMQPSSFRYVNNCLARRRSTIDELGKPLDENESDRDRMMRLSSYVMTEYDDRLREVERYKAKFKENKQLVNDARKTSKALADAIHLKDENFESLKRRNGENVRLKKQLEATKEQLETTILEVSKVKGELDSTLVEVSRLKMSIPTERDAAVQEFLGSQAFHDAFRPHYIRAANYEKRKWMAVLEHYNNGSIIRKYRDEMDEYRQKGEAFVLSVDPNSDDDSNNEASISKQSQESEDGPRDAEEGGDDDGVEMQSDIVRGSASDEDNS